MSVMPGDDHVRFIDVDPLLLKVDHAADFEDDEARTFDLQRIAQRAVAFHFERSHPHDLRGIEIETQVGHKAVLPSPRQVVRRRANASEKQSGDDRFHRHLRLSS